MSLSDIGFNGFVIDGLQAFYHCGNFDGNNNYITNSPFPNQLTDLTENEYSLSLYNFAGTSSSGANGDNTEGSESYIKFDNNNDYGKILIGNLTGVTKFTIQITVYISPWASYKNIIKSGGWSVNRGFTIQYHWGETNFDIWENESSSGKFTFDSGQGLFNFALTFDNSLETEADIYVDGISQGTINRSMSGLIEDIFVGTSSGIDMRLYNLAIYNKKLSQAEVQQNYNAGLIWSSAPVIERVFCTLSTEKFANNSVFSCKYNNNSLSVSKYTNSYLEVSS